MPRNWKDERLGDVSQAVWEACLREDWEKNRKNVAGGTGFSKSSRKIRLKDSHILQAECRRGSTYKSSSLDLDECLAFSNGIFTGTPGTGSLQKCQGLVQLQTDGKTLSVQLPRQNSRASFDLDKMICNVEGTLEGMENWHWACNLCNSFPRPGRKMFPARELRGPDRAINCPSCRMLETILCSLEPKGFEVDNTIIAYQWWPFHTRCERPALQFICKRERSVLYEEFEIYRHKGDHSKSFQFSKRFVPRCKPISSGSASQECLSQVRSWIAYCEQNHEACRKEHIAMAWNTSQPPLPSRVLEVGQQEGDVIRLKHSKGSTGRYICLSHCWGQNPTLMLTKANLSTLSNGISKKDLQAVYRDAIEFCKRLGVKYIWIDSLCIVQDDANDWALESAKMASYYGQCYICLAATSAADHDEGCSTTNQSWNFNGDGMDELPYHVRIRTATKHIQKDLHSEYFPLLKRAWVYQERRLSPRVLHFNKAEVSIECNTGEACECRRRRRRKQIVEWTRHRELHHVGHQLLGGAKDDPTRMMHEWHAIVREYLKLDLKFATDRLPAIAGLAEQSRKRREAAQVPPGRYLAGLWEQHLPSDMAWCVNRDFVWAEEVEGRTQYDPSILLRISTAKACHPRSKEYIAPSWSWASVRDPVNFSPFEFKRSLCKILHSQTEPVGSSEYGQISSGFLIIQAPLLESRCSFESNADRLIDITDSFPFGIEINGSGSGMPFWPDYNIWAEGRGQVTTTEALYLMPLASRVVVGRDSDAEFRFRFWPGAGQVEGVFLVLRRTASANIPVFERIGWANHFGSANIPYMSRATDTKFMLV